MAPNAKKADLLYVSDYATNDVSAYSFPGGKLRGVLRGVLKHSVLPVGLCADGAGNVYIPNNSNATVVEYPHGGVKPLRTLPDPNEYPHACAVDTISGDLAVVNYESVNGAGGVSIYRAAQGRPKRYRLGFVYKFYFAAYDRKGNLYVDASDDVPSEPYTLLELRKGAHSLHTIALDRSPRVAGAVAWDGTYVAIADSRSSVIQRYAVHGRQGIRVATTRLRGAHFITQFLFAGADLVAANFEGANVGVWSYPQGGAPLKRIESGLSEPFGVTLSFAPPSDVVGRPAKVVGRM